MCTSRLYMPGQQTVDVLQSRLRLGIRQCHLHLWPSGLQERKDE